MIEPDQHDQCQLRINEHIDDNLVFNLIEMTDNNIDFEVRLINGLIVIGTIHYSKISRKYSYHPELKHYIYYTPHMLDALSKVTEGANKALLNCKDISKEIAKILEKKKIPGEKKS